MAFTDEWNTQFEAEPENASAANLIGERIRELKLAISERLDVEHDMGVGAGVDGDMRHKFQMPADDAALAAVTNPVAGTVCYKVDNTGIYVYGGAAYAPYGDHVSVLTDVDESDYTYSLPAACASGYEYIESASGTDYSASVAIPATGNWIIYATAKMEFLYSQTTTFFAPHFRLVQIGGGTNVVDQSGLFNNTNQVPNSQQIMLSYINTSPSASTTYEYKVEVSTDSDPTGKCSVNGANPPGYGYNSQPPSSKIQVIAFKVL